VKGDVKVKKKKLNTNPDRPWHHAVMEQLLILLSIATLITFFLMIVVF